MLNAWTWDSRWCRQRSPGALDCAQPVASSSGDKLFSQRGVVGRPPNGGDALADVGDSTARVSCTRLLVCLRLCGCTLSVVRGLVFDWGMRPRRCINRLVLYQWTQSAVSSSTSASRSSGPCRKGESLRTASVL